MPKLTIEQSELAAQFADYSFDYPQLVFAAAAEKAGIKFPNTPAGRLFREECKKIFDQERQ
jgi:hypothetical protein